MHLPRHRAGRAGHYRHHHRDRRHRDRRHRDGRGNPRLPVGHHRGHRHRDRRCGSYHRHRHRDGHPGPGRVGNRDRRDRRDVERPDGSAGRPWHRPDEAACCRGLPQRAGAHRDAAAYRRVPAGHPAGRRAQDGESHARQAVPRRMGYCPPGAGVGRRAWVRQGRDAGRVRRRDWPVPVRPRWVWARRRARPERAGAVLSVSPPRPPQAPPALRRPWPVQPFSREPSLEHSLEHSLKHSRRALLRRMPHGVAVLPAPRPSTTRI